MGAAQATEFPVGQAWIPMPGLLDFWKYCCVSSQLVSTGGIAHRIRTGV
jgi:hypothetical protein